MPAFVPAPYLPNVAGAPWHFPHNNASGSGIRQVRVFCASNTLKLPQTVYAYCFRPRHANELMAVACNTIPVQLDAVDFMD